MDNVTIETPELQKKLDEIKAMIKSLWVENIPLCDKPTDKELYNKANVSSLSHLRREIRRGSDMHTYTFGADENVWTFPDGVEERVDNDKYYKIWYTYHDAADPDDMSTYHHVWYIEEVLPQRLQLKHFLREILNEFE